MAYQFVGAKADPLARKGLSEVKSQLSEITNQIGSSELETTAQNIIEAINEIKAIEATAAGIDDASVSAVLTWSSDKINTHLAEKASIEDVNSQLAEKASQVYLNATNDRISAVEINYQGITDVKEIDITETLQTKTAYFGSATIQFWNGGVWGVVYFACSPNTKYIITKTSGNYFKCVWIDSNPAQGVSTNGYTDFGSATEAEYTTGDDAKYVLIQVTDDANELDTIKASMSVSYVSFNGAKDIVARENITALENRVNSFTESEEYNDEIVTKIDAECTEGYYIDPNSGAKYPSSSYEYTQKIDVEEGNIINFQNANETNVTFRFVAAYYNDVIVPSAGITSEGYDYTVPSGVNSIKVTFYTSRNVAKISVNKLETKTKVSIKPNKLGYTLTRGSLADGESLKLPYHNVKNGNVLVFSANIASFSSIKIGKQSDAYITIDGTDVVVTAGGTILRTYQHGLTIGRNIQILLENDAAARLSLIRIVSDGNEYSITDNTTFLLDEGSAYVTSIGSTFNDCVFSWTSRNINKPIWLFGDSYFSWYPERWTYYLARDGFTESCMLNGYAGENSRAAYSALENLLKIRTPQMVVWCLGMNDPDGESAISSAWKEFYDKVVSLSKKYAFELVLYTTPTTPTMNNNFKNAIVRSSGYRYVDADKAVRINDAGNWITGALDVDNVHPTSYGAKVLYYKFLADLPELTSR